MGTSCITYRELCYKWVEDLAEFNGSYERSRKKFSAVKRYIPYLGERIVADIVQEDIMEAGKKLISEGLKPQTINSFRYDLSKMFRYGIKIGVLDHNPAEGIVKFLYKENKYQRYYLTERELCEYLTICKTNEKYMLAVFFICGIAVEKFVPLQWKDIDFTRNIFSLKRRMASKDTTDVIDLERTERIELEEPEIAFDYLRLELRRQSLEIEINEKELMKTSRYIMTKRYTIKQPGGSKNNISCGQFEDRIKFFLKTNNLKYHYADLVFSSAVYAFRAGCDVPTVASMIGYYRALEMFRHPEYYDCFEPRTTNNINEHMDELFCDVLASKPDTHD